MGRRSAEDVVDELMRVTARLRRVTRRRVYATLGVDPLPEAQRELLHVVSSQPGIGVAGAAGRLGLAGNSVSTLVNSLVESGMLVRQTDPNDRRAAQLTLTDAADKRLSAWRSARAELLGTALRRSPPEDRAAIETALPALQRLLTTVSEETTP